MSGVVFSVNDKSPHSDVAGQPVYFCCAACAAYFAQNQEHVLALRRQ